MVLLWCFVSILVALQLTHFQDLQQNFFSKLSHKGLKGGKKTELSLFGELTLFMSKYI